MTHIRQMSETEGEFHDWQDSKNPCPQCRAERTRCRSWESHDGLYEDYQYRCGSCGHTWWIDGIDS